MKRVSHFSLKHQLRFVPLGLVGASFVIALSGCPQGADLEDPKKYGLSGGSPSTGTGGGTGATGGTSGTGGTTGGSAGSGAAGAPSLVVDCGSSTWQTVITNDCSKLAGCHKGSSTIPPASMLNLTADSGIVSRIKDVKAVHGDITCGTDNAPCTPASCDPNALLVNSATPSASWILAKIKGTQSDCGAQMPSSGGPPAADETCLENFVNAVAALPK
jgi:hypothetical protein